MSVLACLVLGLLVLPLTARGQEKADLDEVTACAARNIPKVDTVRAVRLVERDRIGSKKTTVAKIYGIADVSVVPSREEPFGLVAIEALACGTPVVATEAGGLVDFVNEKVGYLVPMEDPGELGAAIWDSLAFDFKGNHGPDIARYARERFSWDACLDRLQEVFEKAVSS